MLKPSAFMTPFFLSSQPGLAGGLFTSGSKSAGAAGVPGENLFAMLLAGMKPGEGISGSVGDHASVPPGGQQKGIHDGTAAAFLESVFLNQGVSPDNVVLSREDLDFLNNVLSEMGFSRSELVSFFKIMEETRSDGLITLNHFLKDLSAFEQNELRETDPVNPSLSGPFFLDKSAVPHLELILRDLGLSPEKVNDLLSAASLKTGAIDIGKLVFQLKSRMHSNPVSPEPSPASNRTAAQTGNLKAPPPGQYPAPDRTMTQESYLKGKGFSIAEVSDQTEFLSKDQNRVSGSVPEKGALSTDPMLRPKDPKNPAFDPPPVRRVASGLEKLGLSVPNKPPHQPFTLEMLIQALEKKTRTPVQIPRHMPMDSAQLAETVQEMPAVKAMKMEKTNSFFGFAREMMIDRQNKPAHDKSASQLSGKRAPLSVNTRDTALQNQGHPRGDSRIPPEDVPVKASVHQADAGRRTFRMDYLKPDTEKTAAAPNTDIDSRPMPSDLIKTDSGAGLESRQALMTSDDGVQRQSMTFAAAVKEVSAPGRSMGMPQQGPLPAAVVTQVGKEIASFLQRGERIFTLQLKPPELGMVTIEMDVKENALKMSVVAETSSAKEMLHANYVDLRRVLEGFGVRVESFDVQLSGNLNNHASANGDGALNQQSHSHGRFGRNVQPDGPGGDTAGEDDIGSPGMMQPGKDGLLDLLA